MVYLHRSESVDGRNKVKSLVELFDKKRELKEAYQNDTGVSSTHANLLTEQEPGGDIGRALNYSEEDIQAYQEHVKSLMQQHTAPE